MTNFFNNLYDSHYFLAKYLNVLFIIISSAFSIISLFYIISTLLLIFYEGFIYLFSFLIVSIIFSGLILSLIYFIKLLIDNSDF